MIKALSPYWIEIPFVSPNTSLTCTDFTLQVFVWNGDKATPPTTPTFEVTKTNPTASTGDSRINIANLVSDFIDFTQQEGTVTSLINGNNQVWVKYRTFYTTTDPEDYTNASNINTSLMLRGYSYGMDGENQSTPTNKILLSGNEFKVSRNSFFVLPIKIDEPAPTPVIFTLDSISFLSGTTWRFYYTKNFVAPFKLSYKLVGDVNWSLSIITLDTGTYIESDLAALPAGDYEFRLYFYNPLINGLEYSNIIAQTI
jgi:hypothetical protein